MTGQERPKVLLKAVLEATLHLPTKDMAYPGKQPHLQARPIEDLPLPDLSQTSEELLRKQLEEETIRALASQVIFTCLGALKSHSIFAYLHSLRVAWFAEAVYQEVLNLPPNVGFVTGACHDWGKIRCPASILDKPGLVDGREYDKIKEHPYFSFVILEGRGYPLLARIVLGHHSPQPRGYPPRYNESNPFLRETQRLLALADWFAAKQEERPEHGEREVIRRMVHTPNQTELAHLDASETEVKILQTADMDLALSGGINLSVMMETARRKLRGEPP